MDVSVKITGRILERLVKEGDKVSRGQLLVRLDDSELAADVKRQEAALRSAQATLRDLEKGARQQEIEDARAAVSSAEATRSMTEREFQRNDQLFKQNLIAAQDVDRARQAYEVARAQERSAREKLALILEGSRPDQIDAARWQVTQAESALAQAQSRLREAQVISPIDGVVLRKNLEAGETANPGVPILTLVNPKDVWLRAYVPETEVGRLKVGRHRDPPRRRLPGPRLRGPPHRDRLGGRVHAAQRADQEGAGQPRLPHQDPDRQPRGDTQARTARRRRCRMSRTRSRRGTSPADSASASPSTT